MGLTISYTLSTQRKPPESILLQFAERTAEFARKIGCGQVFGPHPGGPGHWKMWKLPDGSTTGEQLSALDGCSVSVLPGEGCENADFGLCRYPGVKGWKLTSCCKTQYAARHGIEHFLACHRRVISLLDLWRDFGVKLDVCDEGEYWQTRSLDNLRQRVGGRPVGGCRRGAIRGAKDSAKRGRKRLAEISRCALRTAGGGRPGRALPRNSNKCSGSSPH
jgi:hypothetical protein